MFRPHQLELFYYVARYGGISAAVRHIRYGIGQPAVSGQMAQFEREVGLQLFERRPFRLTEPGRLIYEYIRPHHEGLEVLWEEVRRGPVRTVRIAAAGTLGPEILPMVIAAASPLPEQVRLELLTGRPEELEAWVQERRVQLAITPADRRVRRVCSRVIGQLGLQLLVPRKTRIDSAGYFWSRKHITEPLISPAEGDPVGRRFASGIKAMHVEWAPSIYVQSPEALQHLVSEGQGAGIGLDLPWVKPDPKLRALPLAGFDPVPVLLLWRKPVDPLLESLLTVVADISRKLWPGRPDVVSILAVSWLVSLDEWIGVAQLLIEG